MRKHVYTVGQVNSYISNMFAQDFMMNKIYVKGEVSNCKYHPTGHIYFTLKDQTGALGAVMFSGSRKGLAFPMRNGDNVIVLGSISVYERDGKYQLYAKEIIQDGAGLLYQRFEALKQELLEMGMFAEEYKQPIPKYAGRVGIVTAATGAAIRDIQNIAGRRNPYVQLILYPALVQGEGAVESIVRGIEALDGLGLDVLIVGRGGGSMEDLWAFNEEAVARAIFNCQTPVISAVGHETDVTIADYVADLRAPTPSAAAELAVYDVRKLLESLSDLRMGLNRGISQQLSDWQARVSRLEERLQLLRPENLVNDRRTYCADLEHRLGQQMEQKLAQIRQRLQLCAKGLEGASPLERLSQGYSVVTNTHGKSVTDAEQVQPGDALDIQLFHGRLKTQVTEVISDG
ncbi:MAG: exodeoxyribonuclease VII large subunit [Lachnospiraceae bacterium]|nr:exodeoxyribonuclease VII large subunit [Lachnospiraceae bacterium]